MEVIPDRFYHRNFLKSKLFIYLAKKNQLIIHNFTNFPLSEMISNPVLLYSQFTKTGIRFGE